MPKYHLTSKAVQQTADGNYAWEVSDWLIPHEPIRRELLRGQHALKHMDAVEHPWKAFGFRLWLCDFFVPAVHTHHDNEEVVVGPFFKSLGAKPEFGETKSHKELLDLMDQCEKEATALADSASLLLNPKAATEDNKGAVKAAHAKLKASWDLLVEFMDIHLAEEERVWPALYRQYGQDKAKVVLDKILAKEMASKGKHQQAFRDFLGSILDSQGINLAFPKGNGPATPAHALNMGPWCSATFAAHFLKNVPWVPRALIFPGWQKQYILTWKALMDSLSGPDNVTGVTPKGFPKAVGCCM